MKKRCGETSESPIPQQIPHTDAIHRINDGVERHSINQLLGGSRLSHTEKSAALLRAEKNLQFTTPEDRHHYELLSKAMVIWCLEAAMKDYHEFRRQQPDCHGLALFDMGDNALTPIPSWYMPKHVQEVDDVSGAVDALVKLFVDPFLHSLYQYTARMRAQLPRPLSMDMNTRFLTVFKYMGRVHQLYRDCLSVQGRPLSVEEQVFMMCDVYLSGSTYDPSVQERGALINPPEGHCEAGFGTATLVIKSVVAHVWRAAVRRPGGRRKPTVLEMKQLFRQIKVFLRQWSSVEKSAFVGMVHQPKVQSPFDCQDNYRVEGHGADIRFHFSIPEGILEKGIAAREEVLEQQVFAGCSANFAQMGDDKNRTVMTYLLDELFGNGDPDKKSVMDRYFIPYYCRKD